MMTRQQVESILARATPQDRELALKSLEHSCSMYDEFGNHIPHDYEKENLLEVIDKRDAYVIDNSSTWKQECRLAENQQKAFIISPSLSRENPNTKHLILDTARCKLGNIFSVGILPTKDGYFRIMVDRIDEHFRYVFDNAKLSEASKGKGQIVAKQKAEIWGIIENDKRLLRKLLRFEKACDLPPADKLQAKINHLKSSIKRHAPECKYDINKAKTLVSLCYICLLMEDTQPRKDAGPRHEFDQPNYENVFGDMYVVQTAIYLRAKILTRDGYQCQMASYADINCHPVPRMQKSPV